MGKENIELPWKVWLEENKLMNVEAKHQVRALWEAAEVITSDTPLHGYLAAKGLHYPFQSDFDTKIFKNWICIPIEDLALESVWGDIPDALQFINEEGKKIVFPSIPLKLPCTVLLNANRHRRDYPFIHLFAEGYSTGLSLNQITRRRVNIVFGANNLKKVGKYAKEICIKMRPNCPDSQPIFVFCGDNDAAGIKEATEAAIATNGYTVFPPAGIKDFNDWAKLATEEEITNHVLGVIPSDKVRLWEYYV